MKDKAIMVGTGIVLTLLYLAGAAILLHLTQQ